MSADLTQQILESLRQDLRDINNNIQWHREKLVDLQVEKLCILRAIREAEEAGE